MIKSKGFLAIVCMFCLAASWPVKMLYGKWEISDSEKKIFGTMVFKPDHTFTGISKGPSVSDTFSGTYVFEDGILSMKKYQDKEPLKSRVVVLTASRLGMHPADNAMGKDTIFFKKVK
jgi:hypothetical protein